MLKDMKTNLRIVLKTFLSAKFVSSVLLILMWLMSSKGYYNYINGYFQFSFEQWRHILEVRADIIYILVRFHVAVLLFIVLMSGFLGIISMIVANHSENRSRLEFMIFGAVGTFIVMIFAIGIQLNFEDPQMIIQSLINVPNI